MSKKLRLNSGYAAPKLRLNGKHSVTIRMGASAHDITLDGATIDLSKRHDEDSKDHAKRIQRTADDLNNMIFG